MISAIASWEPLLRVAGLGAGDDLNMDSSQTVQCGGLLRPGPSQLHSFSGTWPKRERLHAARQEMDGDFS